MRSHRRQQLAAPGPRAARASCSPGTTARGATCRGARRPARVPDPWHVLVSELMLQQTTVATVRGAVRARSSTRFPTLASLAEAPLDDVLHAWQGLGYYRRARALHACAQAVVARHGGRLPLDRDALLELPGIGPYTAAAVAAIAGGRPVVPVDANVERVLARMLALTSAAARGAAAAARRGARRSPRRSGPAISRRR